MKQEDHDTPTITSKHNKHVHRQDNIQQTTVGPPQTEDWKPLATPLKLTKRKADLILQKKKKNTPTSTKFR